MIPNFTFHSTVVECPISIRTALSQQHLNVLLSLCFPTTAATQTFFSVSLFMTSILPREEISSPTPPPRPNASQCTQCRRRRRCCVISPHSLCTYSRARLQLGRNFRLFLTGKSIDFRGKTGQTSKTLLLTFFCVCLSG